MQWVEDFFSIQEPIYRKLSVVFFVTIDFEKNMVDPKYGRALAFWLGEEYQKCSLVEFVWRMALFGRNKVMFAWFSLFLHVTSHDFSVGTQDLVFWRMITNRMDNSKYSQESHIRSPVHRFIHCLITFRINNKGHGDRISSQNLFYLWSIITPKVFCNLPYMLAWFWGENSVYSRMGCMIIGGHFMTRLAKSYGISIPSMVHSLTCIPGNDLPIH